MEREQGFIAETVCFDVSAAKSFETAQPAQQYFWEYTETVYFSAC